jgi:hypothetical protein
MRKKPDIKLSKNKENLKFLIMIDDFLVYDSLIRRKPI